MKFPETGWLALHYLTYRAFCLTVIIIIMHKTVKSKDKIVYHLFTTKTPEIIEKILKV